MSCGGNVCQETLIERSIGLVLPRLSVPRLHQQREPCARLSLNERDPPRKVARDHGFGRVNP
jgi:hypothetical protein